MSESIETAICAALAANTGLSGMVTQIVPYEAHRGVRLPWIEVHAMSLDDSGECLDAHTNWRQSEIEIDIRAASRPECNAIEMALTGVILGLTGTFAGIAIRAAIYEDRKTETETTNLPHRRHELTTLTFLIQYEV